MSPAELADRIGHTSYAVDGSAVSADGRVRINIRTHRVQLDSRNSDLVQVTVQNIQRPDNKWEGWRTAGELRVMAIHLRQVAAEWERAAGVAEDLARSKPTPTPEKPRRLKRRENARFANLDMDPVEAKAEQIA